MDYEKKYREALERAKKINNEQQAQPFDVMTRVFPELKESEDERIRKELIDFVKSRLAGFPQCEKFISWLEKQGEHTNFRNKIQVGDKVTRNEAGILVNLSQLERVAKPRKAKPADKVKSKFSIGDEIKIGNEESLTITKIDEKGYWSEDLFICSFEDSTKWELVEKLVDKVEPNFNFKVGQWIVATGECVYLIAKIDGFNVTLVDTNGDEYVFDASSLDDAHQWTLTDTKDGDVLVCKGDIKGSNGIKYERICLFKNLDSAFFTLTKTSNYIEEYDIDVNIDYPDNTVPATKEQKEILFMAMSDAGYTFDFEKKELIEESKNIKNQIMSEITDLVKDCITPKPAEWSEDDEDMLYKTISVINRLCAEGKEYVWSINTLKKLFYWLKSLKNKYTWKPSDGQMDSITCAVRQMKESACYDSELVSLYQDLKKLKEE